MENTRLIMLEGLPGTGKSTKSFFLSMQLSHEGKPARWIHEVARPHPVLFFNEASLTYEEYSDFLKVHPQAEPTLSRIAVFRKSTVGIDLLELEWNYLRDIGMDAFQALQKYDVWTFSRHKYADVALEKWTYFVEKALQKTDIYILDSSLFQYQIFSFMLKNTPYVELEQFIQKLIDITEPLNPSLIYFYRENAQDTINFLERLRGTQFMQNIWKGIKTNHTTATSPKEWRDTNSSFWSMPLLRNGFLMWRIAERNRLR